MYLPILPLLTLSLAASATPLEHLFKRGAFTLPQVEVQAPRLSLAEAIQRDYMRYGLDLPDSVRQAVKYQVKTASKFADEVHGPPQVDGTGSVAATPGRHDIQYLVNAQVGRHNMTLNLDTGSADL